VHLSISTPSSPSPPVSKRPQLLAQHAHLLALGCGYFFLKMREGLSEGLTRFNANPFLWALWAVFCRNQKKKKQKKVANECIFFATVFFSTKKIHNKQ
jgi:hypothetical protein